MKRLVAVFLIPMFMLGQPLPHSHAGTGIDRPDDHAARPHLHLSPHSHEHGHSHGTSKPEAAHHHGDPSDSSAAAADGTAAIVGLDAHDDDAFYLASVTLSHHRLIPAGQPVPVEVVCDKLPERLAGLSGSTQRCWIPLRRCSGPPIYLLTASLRL